MKVVAGGCLGALLLSFAVAAMASDSPWADALSAEESAELDRVVADVCTKEVVLLGEDPMHGSGRTMTIKTHLLARLIDRCGIGGVVFEAPIYETIGLERRLSEGQVSPREVADAAGQLWSWSQESVPLVELLHRHAVSGQLRIGGMGLGLSTMNARYSQGRLGDDLAALLLDSAERVECAAAIRRYAAWTYDDAHPFDDAAIGQLRRCADAIRKGVEALPDDAPDRSALDVLSRTLMLDGSVSKENAFARQRQAYVQNLDWYRARWPKGTRIVVWASTVHGRSGVANAEKALPADVGAHLDALLGERFAVIGFSAATGLYGNIGGRAPARTLAPAAPGSLEARVLGDADVGLRYADRKALRDFGSIAARPVSLGKIEARDWSDWFDGVIVLREETPMTPLAPASQ